MSGSGAESANKARSILVLSLNLSESLEPERISLHERGPPRQRNSDYTPREPGTRWQAVATPAKRRNTTSMQSALLLGGVSHCLAAQFPFVTQGPRGDKHGWAENPFAEPSKTSNEIKGRAPSSYLGGKQLIVAHTRN